MGRCPIYPSKRREGGTSEAAWKFWGREKSLAPVGIHYMDKMHKMEVFVASYKVVCGGMETRVGQLIIPFLCLVYLFLYNVVYVFLYQEGK
jgi:hypothetical protein